MAAKATGKATENKDVVATETTAEVEMGGVEVKLTIHAPQTFQVPASTTKIKVANLGFGHATVAPYEGEGIVGKAVQVKEGEVVEFEFSPFLYLRTDAHSTLKIETLE